MNKDFLNDFVSKLNTSFATMFLFGETPNIKKMFNNKELTPDSYMDFIQRHNDTNIWFISDIHEELYDYLLSAKARPRNDNIIYKHFFIYDIDLKYNYNEDEFDSLEKRKNLCLTLTKKLLKIPEFKKIIYYILFTGNGIHVATYSVLPQNLKSKNYKLLYFTFLNNIQNKLNIKIDTSVSSPVSPFRLPGSKNFKLDKSGVQTEILYYNKEATIF